MKQIIIYQQVKLKSSLFNGTLVILFRKIQPNRAITEACVNSIIHRDYLEYGSEVHVDIYDDRLEIYSPGGMFDGSLVQNLDPMNIISKRRNPVIADIFSRLRLMERCGSGFKKIMEDYRAYSSSKEQMPNLRSDAHNFFIVLPNLNYGRKDVEYINGGNMVNATVNELDATLIKIRRENPSVNYAFLAKEAGKDRATIARHLKSM